MNASVDIRSVRIETPRLILRPWKREDLADFYAYASAPGVGEMAGWPHHESVKTSEQILEMFIRENKVLALELKENHRVIGSLGLEPIGELDASFDSLQGREIGYVLSKEYWGRGLMPEAVQAVISYCFHVLHYDFLTCGHFAGNDQSRRVIEKCGFHYLKDISFQTRMGTSETTKLYVRMCGEKQYV